jgi:hypothetical protein
MTAEGVRLNITLDAESAAKLTRMAQRIHIQEGTLARSLLATALDEADPDARTVGEVLEGIPDAWDRANLGLAQGRAGETIPLDAL